MKILSADYPVWLCDIWGVVHDGVRPFATNVAATIIVNRFREAYD